MASSTSPPTSRKTNFQKVQEFNRAFDMAPKEPAYYLSGIIDELGRPEMNAFIHARPHLISSEPKLIRLRLDLIKEELGELQTAIAANDFIEIRDALSDILYVVYGMGDVLGINMDELVQGIIKSQVPTTIANGMQIFESITKLSNQDETNGKPIGMTNWNWLQSRMLSFPSQFYHALVKSSGCISGGAEGGNIERDKLVSCMVATFANLEDLCGCALVREPNLEDCEKIGEELGKLIALDYTYSYLMDIDADRDFAIVHSSNMSKLCDTEIDALATVADYEDKFKAGTSPYDSPYYYALPELGKWIVKNKSTGKALKNIKYQKVVFS